jgi:hypothetical protein
MDYVPDFLPDWEQGNRIDVSEYLVHSRVRSSLESIGYQTIGFSTGWRDSEWYDAEYFLSPNMSHIDMILESGYLSPFEGMLVESSMLKIVIDIQTLRGSNAAAFIQTRLNAPFVIQREIILGVFDNLADVPSIPGPKFVFAHILSPHPPYIFGPNGEPIEHSTAFTLNTDYSESIQEAMSGYRNQVIFISGMIEQSIDAILSQSNRPVIIILQSDHGRGRLFENEAYEVAMPDRMAILNAYYVPSNCADLIYPEITPVNTFRLLFNCLFDQELKFLDDVTYFGFEELVPIQEVFPGILDSSSY